MNSNTPPQPNNVLATKENEITIYPNPASNEVSIVVNELSVVQLLNIRGNILHQSRIFFINRDPKYPPRISLVILKL